MSSSEHVQLPGGGSAVAEFIALVEAQTGFPGRRIGRETVLRCPVHNDHDPSLNVRAGEDGQPLVICRSQECSFAEICAAIGFQPYGDDPSWTPAGPAVAIYDYRDEGGELLFQVARTADKQFRQRRPDPSSSSGFRWNLDAVRRVPYRLPELLAAVEAEQRIYVCEGEKDADALVALGQVATCNPGGAGKWRDEYSEVLIGMTVTVIADADEPGRRHAQQVAASLRQVLATVNVVEPLIGNDLSDHLAAGHGLDELVATELPNEDAVAATKVRERAAGSAAGRLVALTDGRLELFHTPDGEPFASYEQRGHYETHAVKGSAFELWLRRIAYEQKVVPNGQTLADAVSTLAAQALFEGETRPVALRVGGDEQTVYLDLADESWQVVEVRADGWTVRSDLPVLFRRSKGMLPLPTPTPGGSLAALRPFLNLDEDGFLLFCSWAVGALCPSGPYPVLDLVGEQGTAKSSAARVARQLVDPSKAPLRSPPREERDLMVGAANGWALAFDNVSSIPQWLSDALCRLSTGGGFATRQLYSDLEETIIEAQRPIILTGIGEHVTRSDLLDRTLALPLAPIPDSERRTERDLEKAFAAVHAGLLGALLDGLVGALRDQQDVELAETSRMADFVIRATAAAPSLGWTAETFQAAHGRVRGDAHKTAIEHSPIGPLLLTIAQNGGFEGTASRLLQKLVSVAGDDGLTKQKAWPGSAAVLGKELARIAPDLRAEGIEITRDRGSKTRLITITRIDQDHDGENEAPEVEQSGDGGDSNDGTGSTSPPRSEGGDRAERPSRFARLREPEIEGAEDV